MKVHTDFTMLKFSTPRQTSTLKGIFFLAVLTALSACPSQTVGQTVTITIDKQLLEQVTGVTPPNTGTTPPTTPPTAPPTTPPITRPSSSTDFESPDDGTFDDESFDDEAMFDVVYDIADGLNDWDIYMFSNALHPDSDFAAIMPRFFNQLVEVGTTHQINNITIEEQTENAAVLLVNRYSTAYGSGKTEELYYDLLKVSGEWKLFQIRSLEGSL